MKIIVTGAAGFVGSRLSKSLLLRGDSVLGIDNLNDYYPLSHKKRHLADLNEHSSWAFVKTDICDAESLRQLFESYRPDAVVHLAAMAAVRYSVQHPLIYGEVNVQGSLNLLDAGRLTSRPRYVLASTGSVYGASTPTPFVEEAAAVMPLAPYPASKRAMELFAYTYHHQWQLQIAVMRFFNVYGPHGRPDMMPWHWSQQIAHGEPITLFNGGHLQRDWTYIDDILAGLIAALDAELNWEIVNLGCGRPVSNIDFVRVLEELTGKHAVIIDTPAPSSEPIVTFASIDKAQRLLGYVPRVNVEEGLTAFVEWLVAEQLLEL